MTSAAIRDQLLAFCKSKWMDASQTMDPDGSRKLVRRGIMRAQLAIESADPDLAPDVWIAVVRTALDDLYIQLQREEDDVDGWRIGGFRTVQREFERLVNAKS